MARARAVLAAAGLLLLLLIVPAQSFTFRRLVRRNVGTPTCADHATCKFEEINDNGDVEEWDAGCVCPSGQTCSEVWYTQYSAQNAVYNKLRCTST